MRRRLLRIAERAHLQSDAAAAATSLLLYTEALSGHGDARDSRVMAAALSTRQRIILRVGRAVWDSRRITGDELLAVLTAHGGCGARRLSVLHRLVSLACGHKHGPPSEELTILSNAVVAALRSADIRSCCGICLEEWAPADRVLVPQCGHALHADCFWALIGGPCAPGNRGRCRTCRTPHRWGPLARSNLVCTLAGAAAVAFAAAPAPIAPEEAAELCLRIDEELGEQPGQLSRVGGPAAVWHELKNECSRRGEPFVRSVDERVRRILEGVSAETR